jgi:predicted nucleotidyltransferase component of viral defense system
MQEIALAGLCRANFFKHAAFYGGTALRIFHELNRFSEDLDFSWDGKYQGIDCQSGVYTWKLFYRPNNLQELLMMGHVNIIR